MSHGLKESKLLTGEYIGAYIGTTIGVIKVDTRGLDNGSYAFLFEVRSSLFGRQRFQLVPQGGDQDAHDYQKAQTINFKPFYPKSPFNKLHTPLTQIPNLMSNLEPEVLKPQTLMHNSCNASLTLNPS